jgi:UDP-N-acetylglucosamine 2-epimerase (non-hydrolysing)
LLREGIDRSKIHHVGNVMIDTLLRLLPSAEEHFPNDLPQPYALVTLHRPSNVDDQVWLGELLVTLGELSAHLHIVFPVHPRTRQRIESATTGRVATGASPVSRSEASAQGKTLDAISALPTTLHLLDPLPYLEFLALQRHAAIVITDSGGIQEETTFLGVPCLTVRENTERPVTVTRGTNQLVGRDLRKLKIAAEEILRRKPAAEQKQPDKNRVPLWDGHAAERIAQIIVRGSVQGSST